MDIRQILNTPHDVPTQASSSISHVTTPFTKRSEAPSSSEGSADITKRQQASSSPAVYLVFTKRSGKHMDTEVETHGIYTCLETAINRASRKVEDGEPFPLPLLYFSLTAFCLRKDTMENVSCDVLMVVMLSSQAKKQSNTSTRKFGWKLMFSTTPLKTPMMSSPLADLQREIVSRS